VTQKGNLFIQSFENVYNIQSVLYDTEHIVPHHLQYYSLIKCHCRTFGKRYQLWFRGRS